MAHQALPPGAARRRAVFGLLDADGWTWAGLRATFWFLVIVFMLGYVPNQAYYLTVSNTIDLGYNAVPIVNWCPAENEDLPCPAPAGSVLPWQDSPAELALPAPLSGAAVFQSGTHLYVIGGSTPAGVTAEVSTTDATLEGNLGMWQPAPALPEPRTDAAFATYVGTPYVIGGLDAAGQPTSTVYMGTVEEGRLTGWVLADGSDRTPDLTLPHAVSGASAVTTSGGLMLVGGRDADSIVGGVIYSRVGTGSTPVLGAWEELAGVSLPEPRAHAAAVAIGEAIYLAGGEGPDGASDAVHRLVLVNGEPQVDEVSGQPRGWASAPASQRLPAARAHAAGFTANGVLYVIGGVDGSGAPQATNLWSVPHAASGDLGEWHSTSPTDLPGPRARAPIAAVGSTVFMFGGEDESGTTDSLVRAGLSPKPPFFRLGLFGATIPALSIKGEIGQQLGYLNAMGVGMTNFAILVIVALALSRPEKTRQVIARLSRGRLKAPAKEPYRT